MVRVGEMRDNDYEWQEVRRRRNNRSSNNATVPDIAIVHQRRREEETRLTTYFFPDIPDSFGSKAMLNIFQKYGDAVEVVIPAKRDKGGRRFGFARFEHVRDVHTTRWSTREVDKSRLVWLRVYGVPVHAWNVEFFDMITKPYGEFINEDEGTLKGTTMDVARILIRTEEQKVVDEIVEVEINNEIFRLRIIEDFYGPMRIMVAQDKRCDGRDAESECSDEEEENTI
ncbi:hypothetical protein A2U01_0029284, partial [Trifolium medium]|nr:hypothetical protein [Trifolium medium]